MKNLKSLKAQFFILFLSFFLLKFQSISSLSLQYDQFLSEKSDFSEKFLNCSSFEEKFIKLLSLCDYENVNKEFYFRILNIPYTNDSNSDVLVKFKIMELDNLCDCQISEFLTNKKNPFKCKIAIFDQNAQKCLKGFFARNEKGEHSGELSSIEVNPTGSKNIITSFRGAQEIRTQFDVGGKKRLVSGSSILDIWDALCKYLAPGNIKLLDVSKIGELELRLLRPFARSDKQTWYGKKGYEPVFNKEEYRKSIDYIWDISLQVLKKDFSDNDSIMDVLKRYDGFLNKLKRIFNSNDRLITFGNLVSYIFMCYEKANGETREKFYNDLKTLYKNCLEKYTSQNPSDAKILSALRTINVIDFEKNYLSNNVAIKAA